MNVKEIKTQQLLDLQKSCIENGVDFESLKILIDSEKIKKLHKGHNYLRQTIDTEIEKHIK